MTATTTFEIARALKALNAEGHYRSMFRGIELTVLPWCRAHGVPVMAYPPRAGAVAGASGGARRRRPLPRKSGARGARRVLAQDGVCAIPAAGTVAHVRQNPSLDLRLHESDMLRLDEAFPPPLTPQPLEIL
ncbi:MAG TPA: hypothetical protein VMJ65_05550 [Solirubrobacteraceae bacterium]|nr:hypothetical protein [Solirubrobacteraceae bacterium]